MDELEKLRSNDAWLNYVLKELDDPLSWCSPTGYDLDGRDYNQHDLLSPNFIGDSVVFVEQLGEEVDEDIMKYVIQEVAWQERDIKWQTVIEKLRPSKLAGMFWKLHSAVKAKHIDMYISDNTQARMLRTISSIFDDYAEAMYVAKLDWIGKIMVEAGMGDSVANSETLRTALNRIKVARVIDKATPHYYV